MGEAKRRKLLDPMWGKAGQNSWEDTKQSRDLDRLSVKVKRHIPNPLVKAQSQIVKEVESLSEDQQNQFLSLANTLTKKLESEPNGEWIADFLETAKLTTDSEVIALVSMALLTGAHFT